MSMERSRRSIRGHIDPGEQAAIRRAHPDVNPNRDNFGMSTYVMGRYLTVAEDILESLPKDKIVTVQPDARTAVRPPSRCSRPCRPTPIADP